MDKRALFHILQGMEIGVVVRADQYAPAAAGDVAVQRHACAAFEQSRAVPVNHFRIDFGSLYRDTPEGLAVGRERKIIPI